MTARLWVCGAFVGVFSTLASGQPILTEDFESGLGAWTVMVDEGGGGPNNNTPLVFEASGAGLYGPNTGYPGTRSVGYSSDLAPWDGQQPQWIQMQWPDELDEGVYSVEIKVDRYVYSESTGDYWALGNYVLFLTDTLYDDPLMPYDNDPFPPNESPGDGIRSTIWQGAANGIWLIQNTITGSIDTASGDLEIRLLMHEKYEGEVSVAWDNLSITIKDQSQVTVFTYTDDFQDGLDGWTAMLYGPEPNDTPQTFTSADPLLYDNVNNPGSTSAGYSSDMPVMDYTRAAWLQQQFPAVVDPGTYAARLEYDRYVFRYAVPNYDDVDLFPSSGSGIYGPNTGYPGNQAVGFSYDPAEHDDTEVVWLQQQFPAGVSPGTYDVRLEADVYVFKADANDYELGSRILFLTDDRYDDQGFGPDGDPAPGFRKSTWNQDSAGMWVHIDQSYEDVTTATGDLEFRLTMHDKMQTGPGPVTIAWDNVSFTIAQVDGGPTVFTLSDDFEAGYGNWDVVRRYGDPWGVGNRTYVLTDDDYDNPAFDYDHGDPGPGFAVARWPGRSVTGPGEDEKADWRLNGVWYHEVYEVPITTTTGNIEVRLLLHDKHPRAQAVAWDNVTLTLSDPTGACCLHDGSCTEADPDTCEIDLEGHYQGVFTTCNDPDIHCCPDPFADADGDTDVDQDDFGVMQTCMTVKNAGAVPPGCECFDREPDLDVDEVDLAAFENCASGPGVAADRGCDG